MNLYNRNSLKNLFRNGNRPSEMEFSHLIDSTWNKIEDGLNKTEEEGIQVSSVGASRKVISFYENKIGHRPEWQIGINENNRKGLAFSQPGKEQFPLLYLSNHESVGIGTRNPKMKMEVNGTFGTQGRVGTYQIGKVKADAKWHTIIKGLKGCNAFEIMAVAKGNSGDGNYAMAHAIALNANQGRMGKVNVINSSFRWFDFRDKILFRWVGEPQNYDLQIKTGKHYFMSQDKKSFNFICLHVTTLWDESVKFEEIDIK